MRKKLAIIGVVLFFGLFIYGCSGNSSATETLKAELLVKEELISTLTAEKETLTQEVVELQDYVDSLQSNGVLAIALNVTQLLQDQDMSGLSAYVHPNDGVRFTPYSYVNPQSDVVFTAAQLTGALQDTQVYNWGAYDGTGEPIQLNFADYYDKFVYDVDFAAPHMIGNNVEIGTGNALNNIAQAYPDGSFVEFHFTGFDPQYEGMDWKSLRLVFEELNGTWYLVGIVHNQWTI